MMLKNDAQHVGREDDITVKEDDVTVREDDVTMMEDDVTVRGR
jgi:hypothetical protein